MRIKNSQEIYNKIGNVSTVIIKRYKIGQYRNSENKPFKDWKIVQEIIEYVKYFKKSKKTFFLQVLKNY